MAALVSLLVANACGARSELADEAPPRAPAPPPTKCITDSRQSWSRSFGGLSDQVATDVVTDGCGSIVLTGAFDAELDFGEGLLEGGAHNPPNYFGPVYPGVFVAKLDVTGSVVYSRSFGPTEGVIASHLAAIPGSENAVLAVTYDGTVDFGGSILPSPGSVERPATVLATLDRDGDVVWARALHATGGVITRRPVVDVDGSVLVLGNFEGELHLGATLLGESSGPGWDGFVCRLSASGEVIWVVMLDLNITNFPILFGSRGVAVDANGDVLVYGEVFAGPPVSFGGAPLDPQGQTGFLAKFDGSGVPLWSTLIDPVRPHGLVVEPDGEILTFDATGDTGLWLDHFDASGGWDWQRRFELVQFYAPHVVASSHEEIMLAGYAHPELDTTGPTPIDFGQGELLPSGTAGIAIATLDTSGETKSGRGIVTEVLQRDDPWEFALLEALPTIVADPGGGSVIAGRFSTTIDFGQGSLKGVDANDVFVARIVEPQ